MVAIANRKREAILQAVTDMYTAVAACPAQSFHFPIGRAACRLVGYPEEELRSLPETVVESFAGVGYPFAANVLREGDTVLDIGSGSGTDIFIAAHRVGPRGKVYALDLTEAMRAKLTNNLARAGMTRVEVLAGDAEAIPLPDASVDAITSNGVLNLVLNKEKALAEIVRVLKPGGRLQLTDIALARPIAGRAKRDPRLWAECIVGAVEEQEYVGMLKRAGLTHVEHVSSFDYFAHAPGEDTRLMASYFGAHSVTLRARRPAVFERAWTPAAAQGTSASPLARVVRNGASQLGGIGGAIAASAGCFGAPALVSAAAALGATALTETALHATLYPLFVGFIALSLWQLHASARERERRAPFRLGLAGGVAAAMFLWLMVTGVVPLPGFALYSALGVLVAGSLWEIGARYHEDCIVKVRREMTRVPTAAPRGQQMARGAAIAVAAAAAFYGMYKSVDALAPKAEAGEIACYGINSCKGKTQCATAHNACPGLNSCKGKGFLHASSKECADQGGVPLKGSPADPARKA